MRRLATVVLLALVWPAAAEPLQLEIPATAGRLVTGLYVQRGEEVHITALGEWTMWDGHFAPVNAAGHRYRTKGINWGRLTARIGTAPELAVGTERTWSATEPGELVLYPFLGDLGLKAPAGALKLTIEGGTPTSQVIEKMAAEGVKLTLPADGAPLITNLWVSAGDAVQIDAFGEWKMWPLGQWLTASGDFGRRLSNGIAWGRLIARFGGPDFATEPDYEVGVSHAIRPERGGLLELRPALGEFAGYPREGELTIVIRGARPAEDRLVAKAARDAADFERSMGFLRLHQARKSLGLPDASCDSALMRAAQAHADYLAANGGGHDEDEGKPGFSGATAADRAKAAGFEGQVAGELIHGFTAGLDAVDGLWSTIYHRVPLLDPAARVYGVGVAKGERIAYVVIAGVPTEPLSSQALGRVPEVATYPVHEQVRVPTSWDGREIPSPLDPTMPRPVGYPLSITLTSADIASVLSAKLTTIRGDDVPIWVVAPGSDPAGLLRASAFMVAEEPLDPETSYTAAVTLKTTAGKELTTEWRFTTGLGPRPFLTVPRLGHPANPPIDLGGWGRCGRRSSRSCLSFAARGGGDGG